MTLAEIAHLLGVEPKWVLNTMAALGEPRAYSLALARRLTVTHAIHEATGASLARSTILADRALEAYDAGAPDVIATDHEDVGIVPDIRRILSSLSIRRSVLASSFAPRALGRPPGGRDPIALATAWGLDLTLIAENLARTVEGRVRQLDAMAAFAHRVRRRAALER